MKEISIHNERGEIVTVMQGDEVALQNTIDNITQGWVEGNWFQKNKYVQDGQVLDRPENTATLSGLTLLNVPVPSTIQIGTEFYESTEDTVELEFNLPGTYKVKVISWPHLDKEFTVENPTP